jgi:hypothetical protein
MGKSKCLHIQRYELAYFFYKSKLNPIYLRTLSINFIK